MDLLPPAHDSDAVSRPHVPVRVPMCARVHAPMHVPAVCVRTMTSDICSMIFSFASIGCLPQSWKRSAQSPPWSRKRSPRAAYDTRVHEGAAKADVSMLIGG